VLAGHLVGPIQPPHLATFVASVRGVGHKGSFCLFVSARILHIRAEVSEIAPEIPLILARRVQIGGQGLHVGGNRGVTRLGGEVCVELDHILPYILEILVEIPDVRPHVPDILPDVLAAGRDVPALLTVLAGHLVGPIQPPHLATFVASVESRIVCISIYLIGTH
jgi:hypothetical protein